MGRNQSTLRMKAYTTLNRFNIPQLHSLPLFRTFIPHDPTPVIKEGLVGIRIANEPRFGTFVLENLFL